nr:EamA family transporter [Lachnospiraceae bacterium]
MKKAAPLFVIIAGCLWGSMGIFVRGLSAYGFTSLEIGALRVFGALLFLGVGILIYKKELLRIRPKDIWCFIGTGIVSIVFFNYCYFTTIQMTSLSVAAVLLYTAPAIVTILSVFLFKEKFHPLKLTALVMAFAGCVLVTGILSQKLTLTVPGILLGLGSG